MWGEEMGLTTSLGLGWSGPSSELRRKKPSRLWGFGVLLVVVVCTCWFQSASAQVITVPAGTQLEDFVSSAGTPVLSLLLTEQTTWTLSNAILLDSGSTTVVSLTLIGSATASPTTRVTLDCGGAGRGFRVNGVGARLELINVTLANCATDDQQDDGGGAGIWASGGSVVVLEGSQFVNDSSFNVDSDGSSGPLGGGAVLVDSGASLSAVACVFTRNSAYHGGAIYASDDTTVSLSGCTFSNNLASKDGNGGAVHLTSNCIATITSCKFTANQAPNGNGGGLYSVQKTRVTCKDTSFTSNKASYGGAHYGDDDTELLFEESIFEENAAINSGGVVEIGGNCVATWKGCRFLRNDASGAQTLSLRGGLSPVIDSCYFEGTNSSKQSKTQVNAQTDEVTILNTTFTKGFGTVAGVISAAGSLTKFLVEDSLFIGNTGLKFGAITFDGFGVTGKTDIRLKRVRFENNRALSSGGAIGGQASNDDYSVVFEECEFVGNRAGAYGGVGYFNADGRIKFKDCRFWDNEARAGAALAVSDSVRIVDEGSVFEDNHAVFGGALWQTVQGTYRMKNSIMRNNEAGIQGGAFFADQLSTKCPVFEQVKFENNYALEAGGALYFDSSEPACDDEKDFCKQCSFKGNRAQLGYGDNYASEAKHLVPVSKVPSSVEPGQYFQVTFLVKDGFHQTLQGFVEMEVGLKVEGNRTEPLGTLTRQPTRNGEVIFDDILFTIHPGSSVRIHFETEPSTTIVRQEVQVDGCGSSQVVFREDDGLYYCLDEREPDEIARIVVFVAVGITLGLAFVVLALLFWNRKKKPINNATPSMCYVIVLGVVLSAISVTMWTKVDDAMCSLRGWLLALGLTMIFGAIFIRGYRLMWIFRAKEQMQLKRRVITNLDLMIGQGVFLAVIIIILSIWMGVGLPGKRDKIDIDDSHEKGAHHTITYECNHSFPSSLFIIVLIVIQVLLLAFNCIVAFMTRNIPSNFNESKHIAFTMYNAAIMMIVAIVLVIVFSDDPTALLIIIAMTVLFHCLVTLLVLFAPKLYLSFLTKNNLVKLLIQENEHLRQEAWAREREVKSLSTKQSGDTTESPSGGIGGSTPSSESKPNPDSTHSAQ